MKKSADPGNGPTIKKTDVKDDYLRFSFRFFDSADAEMCPRNYRDGFTISLMERLRDISTMTVGELTSNKSKAIRAHKHDWDRTARPNGFALNEQYQAYPGWQFEISVNQHGRVHGLIIDQTFYVVWLDHNHKLYP